MDDQDRPAISTARLEQLFGGVRGELTVDPRRPPACDVLRRAARRRRRRRGGAAAAAGVLAFTVLWGWPLLPSAEGGGSSALAGPAPERTISPTLELPGPGLPPSPDGVSGARDAAGRVAPGSGASIDPVGAQLLLPVSLLPTVPGLYGPWSPQADGSTPPSPSPTAAEGCVPALVGASRAARRWELSYADTGARAATAHQYLLEFDSEGAAAEGGALFRSSTNCSSGTSGWTLEDWTSTSAAIRSKGPRPLVEEFTTRVSGTRLAVLLVQRADDSGGSDSGRSGTGLQGEFRVAAGELARLMPG